MDLLQIIILALIQGITEFLPVSSSAHLILPNQILGWPDQGLAFDIAVHTGSLLAVLAYYRRDMQAFALSGVNLLVNRKADAHAILLFKIIVATLPLIMAGWLLKDWVESDLRSTWVIASASIFFGIILWLSDRNNRQHRHSQPLAQQPTQQLDNELSWRTAILIGFAQAIALIPGTSRSGITITAALFLKLSPEMAARFSFLLSIPAILGATTLAVADLVTSKTEVNWEDLTIGVLLSGISAYLCIHFFIKLLQRTGMTPYVIYRIALGILLLTFL